MIQLNVQDKKQIVVPLRFRRASTSHAEIESPEIDDRGYMMGTRQGTWGSSTARGPMVGLTVGTPVNVRVLWEDIDPSMPLFATSTDTAVVQIVEPAGGGPIPASGDFKIKGIADFANRPVAVQLRVGSATGPVLGEIEPHIFTKRKIKLAVHYVRVDDASGQGTRATLPLDTMADRVKAIWWPAGLDIVYEKAAVPDKNDNIKLTNKDIIDKPGDPLSETFPTLKKLSAWDDKIHLFVINRFDRNGVVGRGISPDRAKREGCPPGIFVTTDGVGTNNDKIELRCRTIAHEIGHFLTLDHVHNKHSSTPPADDTQSRRHLMYPLSRVSPEVTPRTLTGEKRFNDNGYGERIRGWLLSLKNHAHHATDDEVAKARKKAQTIQGGRKWS